GNGVIVLGYSAPLRRTPSRLWKTIYQKMKKIGQYSADSGPFPRVEPRHIPSEWGSILPRTRWETDRSTSNAERGLEPLKGLVNTLGNLVNANPHRSSRCGRLYLRRFSLSE